MNPRERIVGALVVCDGTTSEVTLRTGLPVEIVRAEFRRFCELGVARARLGGPAPVCRLMPDVTMQDVEQAEQRVRDMARSGRKAA